MQTSFPHESVARLTQSSSVEMVETIQSLWSGYGEIVRVRLVGRDPADSYPAIVKHVCPPAAPNHKYGWASDRSHQRKLKSYDVELSWYRNFSNRCDKTCRVAKLIAGGHTDPTWLMVLEDLDASGFSIRRGSVNEPQLDACLQWLASFHATFITDRQRSGSLEHAGLWEIGTYWHLATRPDELSAMPDVPLKRAAASIDDRLNDARFQTIVHGDAKLANFCFSDDDRVAAVDFQYVGGGCGMKDLAYFISSCLSDDQCEQRESELLNRYFQFLKTSLASMNDATSSAAIRAFADLETEWRSLYPFAWADFYRFLAGWSPGHWKMHGYSQRLTERVLMCLNGKD